MPARKYIGSELELFAQATNWKVYFASRLRPHLGRCVLEVGAGLGGTTSMLCTGPFDRWICLEPDELLASDIAQSIESGRLPSCCEVVVGTLEVLHAEGLFDTLLYIDVLEHIEDDHAELHRAAGFLKPGGHLVVLSPAHQWLHAPFDKAIGHHRRYSKRTLSRLKPPGLESRRLEYLDTVGMFASLGNRILLRRSLPTARQIQFWDKCLVPVSRWIDPLLLRRLGKSILAVWQRPLR